MNVRQITPRWLSSGSARLAIAGMIHPGVFLRKSGDTLAQDACARYAHVRQNRPDSNEDQEAAWPGERADQTPRRPRWPQARCLNPHPEQVPTRSSCPASSSTPATRCRSSTRWCGRSRRTAPRSPRPPRRSGTPGPPYYEAAAALERSGLEGLVPARPGPRGAAQAHRPDPRLGRAAAGRRPRPAPGAAGAPDRGVLRRARAPPLGRASAGPPPGAPLQKPLTCPPARCGRRSTRPCPCSHHLATRLLNRATARMPARTTFPAAGWTPATSNCVMPPCTHARRRSRSGSAC